MLCPLTDFFIQFSKKCLIAVVSNTALFSFFQRAAQGFKPRCIRLAVENGDDRRAINDHLGNPRSS